MKLFKKPWFALLLCFVVVFWATALSVDLRFGARCREVRDGFYEGVQVDGYTQPGIATHLRNLCGYADGLATIAKNYDVDPDSVQSASNLLKMLLGDDDGDCSDLRFWYDALCTDLMTMEDALTRKDLSERDASGVSQYLEGIHGTISSIDSSAYNDSVRQFLRKYDHFPINLYASLGMVELPELF